MIFIPSLKLLSPGRMFSGDGGDFDVFGYYFYNPQDLSSGAVSSWNGRIVGSVDGDTDKFATQVKIGRAHV